MESWHVNARNEQVIDAIISAWSKPVSWANKAAILLLMGPVISFSANVKVSW